MLHDRDRLIVTPEIYIISEGKKALKLALDLATLANPKASHFEIHPRAGLLLYWENPNREEAHPFPVKLNSSQLTEMAWSWLESVDYEEFNSPDPELANDDGSLEQGWRVYNRDDDLGLDYHLQTFYLIAAVLPDWVYYGK